MRILFIFLCVFLVGCSQVVNGNVTEKEFNQAFTTLVPIPISCGKNCTSFIYVPIYYPPSWDIVVSGVDSSGDSVKNTFYIEKDKWDLIRVGDRYNCGGKNECPATERARVRKE